MSDLINESPDSQSAVACPWCGAEDQVLGRNCGSCDRLIAGLPTWANAEAEAQVRAAAESRWRITTRRLALLGVLLFLAAFIGWLNFPFVSNPITILFKKPTTNHTSASSPGQWSSVGWDVQGTRYISDVARQPEGQSVWSKDLGNPTRSAPTVADGVIYIGGFFKAMALEVESGETIWEIDTPGQMEQSFAVAGDFVYMGLSDHRLLALDRITGETRWEYTAKFPITSSPVVADGMVYFGSSDGIVYALDAATGKKIWKHKLKGNLRSSPSISGGRFFASDTDGNLNILSARTGQSRFRFRTAASASDAAVVDGGLAYFPSGGRIFAVDTGARSKRGEFLFKKIWTQFYVWQIPGVPAPSSQRGERWRFAPERHASLGIAASPAVAPEALYYGDTAGLLYARDVTSREEIWRFQADDGIVSSPIILGDRIYFGARDGYLYSLDRSNGNLVWRLFLDAPIEISPVFAEGRLYIRTNDGLLHTID
ncbi:MAG: hypothetical protein BZY87_03090 [SAR202 cluster bacterium Io17-Chloro-G6]|nr:MAG: hypothetical protein BZY87_03090 [SAR202 cluster bacterium Io17-Chloro-G6]